MSDPWINVPPAESALLSLMIRLRQLMDAVETAEAEKPGGTSRAEKATFTMETHGSNAWAFLSEPAARRLTAKFSDWFREITDERQAKTDPMAAFLRAMPADTQNCNPN